MKSDLRELMEGYVQAAQWSSMGSREGGEVDSYGEVESEHMDSIELASGEEFRLGMQVARWAKKYWEVLGRAAVLLEEGSRCGYDGWALVGHNAWLDAVGHGVGFWDRSELKEAGFGDYLSSLCRDGLPSDCSYACWIDSEGEGRFEFC